MLTPNGTWLSQIQTKNGKKVSAGNVVKRVKEAKSSQRASMNCWEYYLETTYTYPDGSTSKDEIYLGTVCDVNCDDLSYMSLCNQGGGGGGTGVSTDPGLNDQDSFQWEREDEGGDVLRDWYSSGGSWFIIPDFSWYAKVKRWFTATELLGVSYDGPPVAVPEMAPVTDNNGKVVGAVSRMVNPGSVTFMPPIRTSRKSFLCEWRFTWIKILSEGTTARIVPMGEDFCMRAVFIP